jgi:hypothetical protein
MPAGVGSGQEKAGEVETELHKDSAGWIREVGRRRLLETGADTNLASTQYRRVARAEIRKAAV